MKNVLLLLMKPVLLLNANIRKQNLKSNANFNCHVESKHYVLMLGVFIILYLYLDNLEFSKTKHQIIVIFFQ